MKAKFYNRVLSESEIQQEYNSGIPIVDENMFTYNDWIPIDGQWHNVVITCSDGNQKKYVDGELVFESKEITNK